MKFNGFLLLESAFVAFSSTALHAQNAPVALDPPVSQAGPDTADQQPIADIVIKRLNEERQAILPSLGATKYDFSPDALQSIPQGDQASLQSVLLQAPGVATDSFGQLHVRDEHANIQYRLDGVELPEGLSVFGQSLESRLANSIGFIVGSLPAQYGFNQAAIVDITTKSGTTNPGGALTIYGGSHGVLQPSFEYGGRSGPFDYYATGEFLHTEIGIENPAETANATHDSSDQFRGFAHVSDLLDQDTRVSLIAGAFNGDYQIPNNPNQAPTLGLNVNGQTFLNSADLQEHQRELSDFAIVSLQKHYDAVDVQVSGFSRYSSLYYTPDPLGDLLYTGIAQTAARSSWANGVQTDASWQISHTHTIRAGFLAQVERSVAKTSSLVLPVDNAGAQTSDQPFAVRDSSGLTGSVYGLYVQDEWKVLPTLTVNYGARFDVVNEFTHDREVSPRLNVVWQATPTTTAHAGYSRYFTPPPFELVGGQTISRFVGTSAAPSTTQDSVPRAERAHYFDIGVSQIVLPGWTIGLDGFLKLSHDLIDEGQFGSPVLLTAFNYGKGQQQGIEFSTSYDRGPISLYGNFSYDRGVGKNVTSAQINFGADELAYIAQHFIYLDHDQRFTGSAGGAYTLARHSDHPTRFSADLSVESGLRAGTPTVPNGVELPGYYVVNLAAVQVFNVLSIGPTSLRLDVLNLLDRSFVIRNGSGVGVGAPQYGLRRAILAGVTQRF